jgi:hypothetical protein
VSDWPPESCEHPRCELARKVQKLISINPERRTYDLEGEPIGSSVSFENVRVQQWTNNKRIDVHVYSVFPDGTKPTRMEVLVLSFIPGYNIDGTDDKDLIQRTLETVQRAMILDELADV